MSVEFDLDFSKEKNARALQEQKASRASKLRSLARKIRELKKLCDELDPYQGATDAQKKVLKKYHILADTDPFTLTNQLLVLMEDTLEEQAALKKKK